VPVVEGNLATVSAEINADKAAWVLGRVSDRSRPAGARATGRYASLGWAVVLSSPSWIETSM
jgi:hypothetical protein